MSRRLLILAGSAIVLALIAYGLSHTGEGLLGRYGIDPPPR